MAAAGGRLLVVNGVLQTSEAPPIAAFLEGTFGAYTTTRTHGDASVVLFWERHLRRLVHSARILAECGAVPGFLETPPSRLKQLVGESLRVGLRKAVKGKMSEGGDVGTGELAITTIVRGWEEEEAKSRSLDVCVHIGFYVPQVFGTGARLAVAGRGRERAEAKSTEWVRIRKHMEKLRPPLATELLLSNDGDRMLEGSVTNFFVVCRRKVIQTVSDESLGDPDGRYSIEVQTSPVSDGVLPGVIRQLVIEICSRKQIPFREVAPSWADRELWEEAFITNSLRLLQHVEIIQVPISYEDLHLKTWREVSWVGKQFDVCKQYNPASLFVLFLLVKLLKFWHSMENRVLGPSLLRYRCVNSDLCYAHGNSYKLLTTLSGALVGHYAAAKPDLGKQLLGWEKHMSL